MQYNLESSMLSGSARKHANEENHDLSDALGDYSSHSSRGPSLWDRPILPASHRSLELPQWPASDCLVHGRFFCSLGYSALVFAEQSRFLGIYVNFLLIA